MNTITKSVGQKELDFYIKANENFLTPPLVKYEPNTETKKGGPRYNLITIRYPETLADVMNDPNRKEEARTIINKARELVQKLHMIDIFHGDISEDNIVYDPEYKLVALIDFGLSRWISEISPEDIPEIIENDNVGSAYAGEPEYTIDYVLKLDFGNLTFLESSLK